MRITKRTTYHNYQEKIILYKYMAEAGDWEGRGSDEGCLRGGMEILISGRKWLLAIVSTLSSRWNKSLDNKRRLCDMSWKTLWCSCKSLDQHPISLVWKAGTWSCAERWSAGRERKHYIPSQMSSLHVLQDLHGVPLKTRNHADAQQCNNSKHKDKMAVC
jgi:hypothetical protein